ncbi:MAG: hypothetical protein JWO15_981 [Sphingomonadales bacterium]|nr:hypothetical protein [Sphingomonadales bacterium]
MPIGTNRRLEGMLEQVERGFTLLTDQGDVWLLGTESDATAMIGQRIKIEGIRTGFDRIEVEWIALSM